MIYLVDSDIHLLSNLGQKYRNLDFQDCYNIFIVFRPIPSGSFSPGGVYRVGKGQMSAAQFTGCVQDITAYPEVLVEE